MEDRHNRRQPLATASPTMEGDDSTYTTSTAVIAGILFLLLLLQSGCKCAVARACTPLEYIYLPVYALAICADWLQGPYVYALYSALGLGRTFGEAPRGGRWMGRATGASPVAAEMADAG